MLLNTYKFLPWQLDIAQSWLQQKERFAHAWLVHGMPGIGQQQFAVAAAYSLLCENPEHGLACGSCQACGWVKEGNHPDLRLIRSEANMQQEGVDLTSSKKSVSKEIKIEQIRSLQPWFNTATHRGGYRVAVLYLADDLNQAAANALLKILEEPPEHTIFILAANAPDSLLATIVSRCRRIVLPKPEHSQAIEWLNSMSLNNAEIRLAAAGGSPILALQQADQEAIPAWIIDLLNNLAARRADYNGLADALMQTEPQIWLADIQRLCLDLINSNYDLAPYYFTSLGEQLSIVGKSLDIHRLIGFEKWLKEKKPLVNHPLNLKLLVDTMANHLLLALRPASAEN